VGARSQRNEKRRGEPRGANGDRRGKNREKGSPDHCVRPPSKKEKNKPNHEGKCRQGNGHCFYKNLNARKQKKRRRSIVEVGKRATIGGLLARGCNLSFIVGRTVIKEKWWQAKNIEKTVGGLNRFHKVHWRGRGGGGGSGQGTSVGSNTHQTSE